MASNSRGIDEASADLVVWGECLWLDTRGFLKRVQMLHKRGRGEGLSFSSVLIVKVSLSLFFLLYYP